MLGGVAGKPGAVGAGPGFTGTDFNSHCGTQTVTEGTDAIVRLATLPPAGPTGTFQDRHKLGPW